MQNENTAGIKVVTEKAQMRPTETDRECAIATLNAIEPYTEMDTSYFENGIVDQMRRALADECAPIIAAHVAARIAPWRKVVQALIDLRSESRGVIGFHLNGAEADWDEFEFVRDACALLDGAKEGG